MEKSERDIVLDAIIAAQVKLYTNEDDGFFTVSEIKEELGWNEKRIRESLGRLLKAGKLERKLIYRLDLSGRYTSRPGYKII